MDAHKPKANGLASHSCPKNSCPKRYSLPILLALVSIVVVGAAILVSPCGFGAANSDGMLHAPLICGMLGLTLMGCGLVFSFLMYRRHSEIEWLQSHGEKLSAKVVAINEIITPTKRTAYQVICEACDPLSGRLRRFHSEQLPSKPGCCCKNSSIDVLTDPSNPRVYHVEVPG